MISSSFMSGTLVFHDPAYPQVCAVSTLHKLVPGSFQVVDAAQLAASLEAGCQLLVSFHGPYFPKGAWAAILNFLEGGGNLAILGGMPFAHPVNEEGDVEPEQDTYTRQIYLGPFFQVVPEQAAVQLVADVHAHFLKGCDIRIVNDAPGSFWSFYPKMTQVSDHPEDGGSAGPFDPESLTLPRQEEGKSIDKKTSQSLQWIKHFNENLSYFIRKYRNDTFGPLYGCEEGVCE